MSAYIVTQTGVVIEYPTATSIVWISEENYYAALYRLSERQGFICKVPRGCVVSFDRPTSVQQARDAMKTSLSDSLELVTACLKNIDLNYSNKKRLRTLKLLLKGFDSRSGEWR